MYFLQYSEISSVPFLTPESYHVSGGREETLGAMLCGLDSLECFGLYLHSRIDKTVFFKCFNGLGFKQTTAVTHKEAVPFSRFLS